jgi:hypothetical protein
MASPIDTTSLRDRLSSLDAWIWPMTAAILVGGTLVFSSFAGLFWLAAHPIRQSTVIWMQPAASQASLDEQSLAEKTPKALEICPDARTN